MKNEKITYYLPADIDKKLRHVSKKFKVTKGELIVKSLNTIFDSLPVNFWDDIELKETDLDNIIKTRKVKK